MIFKLKYWTLIVSLFAQFFTVQLFGSTGIDFEVRPAKVLGVWQFVMSISESNRRPSKIVVELFQKSDFSKQKMVQTDISDFAKIIKENLTGSYSYPGFPANRLEMAWDIERHYQLQASRSENLEEFRSRTAFTMAQADHHQLFKILNRFMPVYEQLVWNPNEEKLQNYGKSLVANWKKGSLSNLFFKASKFYGSWWPEKYNFVVHMVPIPASKGATTATVIDNSIQLECLIDEDDIPGRVGVIFHEMSHTAYEAQPREFQTKLNGWFLNDKSIYSDLALNLLNEGLATALGNGFAYRQITGKEDEGSWYNNEEISDGAKFNSDLVRDYVNREKTIDEKFVKKWIRNYEKHFPQAPRTLGIRMNEILLFFDGDQYKWQDVKPDVKKNFKPRSLSASTPILSADTLSEIQSVFPQAKLGPALVYILSKMENRSQIDGHLKLIPELKEGLKAFDQKLLSDGGNPKTFSVSDYKNGRLMFFIWAPSSDDLRTQLSTLSKIIIASEKPTLYD